MGEKTSMLGRRSWLLAGLVCAGLGASAMWAVQSGASAKEAGATVRAALPTPQTPPRPPAPAAAPKPSAVRPAVLATNAHCGQVLIASLTLNGDLFCTSGTALTIGKNSVVLNLNGHRIDGNGTTTYGVAVQASSDTVENGVISNFASMGVLVYSATGATSDIVSAIRAINSYDGIVDYGVTTKITNSTATGCNYGIVSNGSGGTYSGDHELNNAYGVSLGANSKVVVTGNSANGNLYNGILDNGAGNTLTKNTANFNGWDGIFAVTDTGVVDGGGNLAKGNDYTSGTPEQCYGVVCT